MSFLCSGRGNRQRKPSEGSFRGNFLFRIINRPFTTPSSRITSRHHLHTSSHIITHHRITTHHHISQNTTHHHDATSPSTPLTSPHLTSPHLTSPHLTHVDASATTITHQTTIATLTVTNTSQNRKIPPHQKRGPRCVCT